MENEILEMPIDDTLWQSIRGELPCADSGEKCMEVLQTLSIENNPTLRILDESIAEINQKVIQARSNNQTAVNLSIFRPLVQRYLSSSIVQEPNQQPRRRGLVENILGIFTDPIGSINEILGLVGVPLFDAITGTNPTQQRNTILIDDLQTKAVQLQQNREELALQIKEKVVLSLLDFQVTIGEFLNSRELATRAQQQHQIFTLSYRFGGQSTQQFLSQQNALDRAKLQAYQDWIKLQRQIKILENMVLPEQRKL
jgi:hypothetical protein